MDKEKEEKKNEEPREELMSIVDAREKKVRDKQ
jgi:hypothetical protein